MAGMDEWDPDTRTYRGVPAPEYVCTELLAGRPGHTTRGWCEGVESALSRRFEFTADGVLSCVPEGQDSQDTGPSLSRDVSAFLAVTEDRAPEARRIVKGMSGRDRAVLSFWLQELSRVVEDAELSRRT